jgi:uncharacterized protein (DUF302 family)
MANALRPLAAVALVLAAGPVLAQDGETEHMVIRTVEASFDDVRLDVENAILNEGLVIDYVARVGEMLNRTAEDVGADSAVFERAESLQFCSATLSRATMEADPNNLGFCPYIVFLYEQAGEQGTVHVGYRRLPDTGSEESRTAIAAVNALLDGIIREAAGAE